MIQFLYKNFIILITILHRVFSECPSYEYTCPSDGSCIRKEFVCDGFEDCPMSGDENREGGCLFNVSGTEQCINGLYTCKSSLLSNNKPFCLPHTAECNGKSECHNGEDESDCSKTQDCKPKRQMFHCSTNQCISKKLQCDGIYDCPYKQDERDCNYPVCSSSTFNCSYGYCIPANKTCDGLWDCRDGSDETEALCDSAKACESTNMNIYCPGNSLSNRCIKISQFCTGNLACNLSRYTRRMCSLSNLNCGANGKIVPIRIGYDCLCNTGYESVVNSNGNITCRDINECDNNTLCDQTCLNTEGGYKCLCNSGFIVSSDNPRYCIRIDTSVEPTIIYENRYGIGSVYINRTICRDIDSNVSSVGSLDFDWQTNLVYYNIYNDVLIKNIKSNGASTNVKYAQVRQINMIAIDWIARKLYFTSSSDRDICVSEIEGGYKAVVVKNVIVNGIALVPSKGYLFFTSNYKSRYISRASMDGKSSIVTIVATNSNRPCGIAVDHLAQRVYWVDSSKKTIEVCDFNGNNRIILHTDSTSYPLTIDVFDGYVYWNDFNTRSIMRADKLTGHNMTVILNYNRRTTQVFILYHPDRQPIGTNPCGVANGGCSHLCLIGEGGVASCVCPISFFLMADNKTCNMQCDNVTQYRCSGNNTRCIALYQVCDGLNNCDENDDEPASCGLRSCYFGYFQCHMNSSESCLSTEKVCNGKIDCLDGSDEIPAYCPNHKCNSNEFRCKDRCIPIQWACDGDFDCSFGEDEADKNPLCTKCSSTQFQCDNKICINADQYCDYNNDCEDRSDEPYTCWVYRAENPCALGYVRCSRNYRCIWAGLFCDGRRDCEDNSDEWDCPPKREREDFTCANGYRISLSLKCDFINHCSDNSDEDPKLCASFAFLPCLPDEFNCSNHNCVDKRLKCNNRNDCGDYSDEDGCEPPCPEMYFQCANTSCIRPALECNGEYNCPDGSDELNCLSGYPNVTCKPDQFQCSNKKMCVRSIYVCDNYTDCMDGSDESSEVCQQYSCGSDEFHCRKINRCIPKENVCDGNIDCHFGADEDPSLCF